MSHTYGLLNVAQAGYTSTVEVAGERPTQLKGVKNPPTALALSDDLTAFKFRRSSKIVRSLAFLAPNLLHCQFPEEARPCPMLKLFQFILVTHGRPMSHTAGSSFLQVGEMHARICRRRLQVLLSQTTVGPNV